MKVRKIFLVLIIMISGIIYYSCDDSGTLPPSGVTSGRITLTGTNVKPLEQGNDGLYQLWLYVNDSLGNHYKTLGKFNVLNDGSIVDPSGAALTFSLGDDTNNLPGIKYALISIEAPGQNNTVPGPVHMLAGPLTLYLDSLAGVLSVSDTLALGSLGSYLQSSVGGPWFILNVTTQTGVNCRRGIWFCDTLGNAKLPVEMDLNPSTGWVYEGWVEDNEAHTYISTGRFYSHDGLDADGAGPCAGPISTTYHVPGQEFVVDSCSSITTLTTGHHGILLTIEPAHRTSTSPFFMKTFEQSLISTTEGCGRNDNVFGRGNLFPKARIKITRSR